jgi:hypothetical protein
MVAHALCRPYKSHKLHNLETMSQVLGLGHGAGSRGLGLLSAVKFD